MRNLMRNRMIACVLLVTQAAGWCHSAADLLEAKLNAIHTMTATFKQTVNAAKRAVSQSSGTMALSRPGRFRWKTDDPMVQWVIADGKQMWIYDVDLEQVTVRKQQKSIGGTAGLFLSNYNDNLIRDFEVTMHATGKQSVFDLRARSKQENFQRIRLLFTENLLHGMELFDQLGQHTHVQLSHVKTNIPLKTALFQFKVPRGVDVIKQ